MSALLYRSEQMTVEARSLQETGLRRDVPRRDVPRRLVLPTNTLSLVLPTNTAARHLPECNKELSPLGLGLRRGGERDGVRGGGSDLPHFTRLGVGKE